MKKLLMFITFVFAFANISTYAIDDLDELDALLNIDEGEEIGVDGASVKKDSIETESGIVTDDTIILKDNNLLDDVEENNTNKKLTLTQKSVTSDSVTLEFTPLKEYTNYKIYYTETGKENSGEKEVTANNQEPIEVIIDGLKQDTEYQFIVKAFDNEGNPVEVTASDPIIIRTAQQHAAPSDNVIYDPVVKVEGNKIIITWKPGVDVQKVQISLSEDGKTFKPVATVSADKKTYTIIADKTGKKYIKLVPISKDGTLGVCKIGSTEVPYITANVQLKKEAEKKIGHSKTGPEIYLLVLIALIIATIYAYRKRLS